MSVILNLFRERIRQTGKAAHSHTHREIVALMDEAAPAPKKRGPYKKKGQENSN